MPHFWTEEQKNFLRLNYPEHSRKELLELLNEHFKLNITLNQLISCLKNNKIQCGRTGYFEKGRAPFNKGLKGVTTGGVQTQFKKGHKPKNYLPVGSERIDKDGYVIVKISDEGKWQQRWRHKHKVVWEKANGKIPEGHCLLFLDRNKLNISLDNLELITKSQLARLNQKKLINDDPELTKTGIIMAGIYQKIGELKKRSEHGK